MLGASCPGYGDRVHRPACCIYEVKGSLISRCYGGRLDETDWNLYCCTGAVSVLLLESLRGTYSRQGDALDSTRLDTPNHKTCKSPKHSPTRTQGTDSQHDDGIHHPSSIIHPHFASPPIPPKIATQSRRHGTSSSSSSSSVHMKTLPPPPPSSPSGYRALTSIHAAARKSRKLSIGIHPSIPRRLY
jgi:hypothetical protein